MGLCHFTVETKLRSNGILVWNRSVRYYYVCKLGCIFYEGWALSAESLADPVCRQTWNKSIYIVKKMVAHWRETESGKPIYVTSYLPIFLLKIKFDRK